MVLNQKRSFRVENRSFDSKLVVRIELQRKFSVFNSEIDALESKIVIFELKIYFCQKFRLFRARIVFGNTEFILMEHNGLELFEDFFGIF